MPERILIELHTLPTLAYCCALLQGRACLLEAHEQYQKQTCRNRYYINTTRGLLRLTVPVQLAGSRAIRDVRIEAGNRWRNQHWRTLEAAYRKAPFFEHYADDLHGILYQPENHFLWDFNLALLSFCLTHLKIGIPVSETVAYSRALPPDILDLRNRLYDRNCAATDIFYRPQPYHQVFGSTFVPNCSALDLLFCAGPAARQYLQLSLPATNKTNK
jgi:hypothetical protein